MPRVLPRPICRPLAAISTVLVLLLEIGRAAAFPIPAGLDAGALPSLAAPAGHLVISEVMTGGASASDEFIELYNPSGGALALDGLEVVYVTASGATVTRKASWGTGASPIPAGAHLLIANDLGLFIALGDLAYSGGLAATGGSVALRVQGGDTAIDAVGWGTAASTWLEAHPAPAPPAGNSLERLPGGPAGSGQDTDDNLLDFAIRSVPDPQNSAAPPVPDPSTSPSASPSPTPSATPTPSPTPTPTQTPTPEPTLAPISIAAVRALPDGSTVTVEGVTLSDQAFTDGGGFIDDGTAGIAVLLSDGSYPRGVLLRVTGVVDDRYSQRTIRADATGISVVGAGTEPSPIDSPTASIGENLEGRLVRLSGEVASALDTLTTSITFDLDDGSGPARVSVGTSTGIDASSWVRGVRITLIGVVGQRDSSGSGTAGYRVQPRDPADIVSVEPPATPTPSPSPEPSASPTPSGTGSASPSPSPSPTPGEGVVSIAEARAAAYGAHVRIHGVVTAPSGLIDPVSAVLQDASGAILIRLSDDVGTLSRGEVVELDGVRSTLSGMLTLRVSVPPTRLGTQAEPSPFRGGTGQLGEDQEAWLVVVRGAVVSSVLHSTAGTVSFSLDDGSGPLRVSISPRAGISTSAITRGAWFELRGVLGQETTGREPDRGYRLWPRIQSDIVLVAGTSASPTPQPSAGPSSSPASGPAPVLTWHSATASPTAEGSLGALSSGGLPKLTLAMPTASPSAAASSIADTRQAATDQAPRVAGLLAGAFGMALIAGFLAWRSRRLRPQPEVVLEEGVALSGQDEAVRGLEQAAVMPPATLDTHEGERILPPI